MINRIINIALRNRIIVLLVAAVITVYGIYAVKTTPVDAIPDLSENQVIIFTEWMGRGPQIIEDQITYPVVSNLQGIPRVKNIRVGNLMTVYDRSQPLHVWIRPCNNRLFSSCRTYCIGRFHYGAFLLQPACPCSSEVV